MIRTTTAHAGSVLLAALLAMLTASSADAISLGQLDDFEDGTTQNWVIGVGGLGTPSNVSTGGPDGVDDGFVQYDSNGGRTAGRMVFFNETQWTGDYLSAGVTEISADVNVLSTEFPSPLNFLNLRVAFGTGINANTGTWFVSTESIDIEAGTGWHSVTFPIDESSLTRVVGEGSYDDLFGSVGVMRILSSSSPSSKGDVLTASLGVDNLLAGPAVQAVDGDFNGDGVVDNGDLSLLLGNWGSPTVPAEWINGFTTPVDNDELSALLGNWGFGTSTSVPEPAAALLAGLGAGVLVRRRSVTC